MKVRVGAIASGCVFIFFFSTARADNAFPSSQSVMLPVDRPQELVVGTTFGLVFSEDGGATWTYSCEQPQATPMGRQYRMGPPPDDRIYTISSLGAPVSTDGACTWTLPRGPVAPLLALDVWPDPSLVARSFVLALNQDDQVASAFRSDDGGVTYQGPIFVADDATITGIESATSDPGVVYLTMVRRSDQHPFLMRSRDGGDTWTGTDIEGGIGQVTPRLIAVDPIDPDKVLLLLLAANVAGEEEQGLAITTDAGATWQSPLMLAPERSLSGFARLPDGTLILVGNVAAAAMPDTDAGSEAMPRPTLFRSDDGGVSFATERLPFHAVGLAQRAGTLYAAANNFQDGFALASSADGGRTWSARLRFRDISAVKACVRAICRDDCDYQAGTTLFPPQTCGTIADAASDGPLPEPPHPRGGGCGCSVSGDASRPWGVTAGLWGAVVLLMMSRRSRSRRRPPNKGV